MPQVQVREEAAAAIGQAIAQSWGEEARLEFDGASAAGDAGSDAAAAVRIGSETVWLAGEWPPGLPEAVATTLGGEVSAEAPPLDAGATCLSYRWVWGRRHGRVDLYATPATWTAFDDGEPQPAVAGGADQAEAAGEGTPPTPEAPPPAAPTETAAAAPAQAEPGPAAGQESLAVLPSLADRRAGDAAAGIDLLLDVPLAVTVELGRAQRQIRDVLSLRAGSVIGLDRPAGEPVDVLVNGKPIARGEVVVIDENFGVRITDVLSQAERLRRLA